MDYKKQSFLGQLSRADRYILICCFFVFAVNGLYAMIIGPILPLISAEYGLNDTVSGLLVSSHQTGNLIAGFLAGIVPLYLGRKKSIVFLSSFVILGFIIVALTGNPLLLILGFLFTGLSRGSISNFNNRLVNDVSNSNPVALNILHSLFAIGALLAPLLVIISTKMGGAKGWRISLGVIILLAATSIYLFSRMEIESSKEKAEKSKISYEFLKDKDFLTGCGILFFYLCAEATINGWLVKYFIDSNIMTIGYAQMLASLLWVVILAGRLSCAFLGNRVSKKFLLLITSGGTTVFYLLLLSTREIGLITFAIMGLGYFMGGIYPTTVSVVGSVINTYPMAMGVLLMLGGVGAILMPIITGALSDSFGIFAGMSAIVVAIIFMLVFVILHIKRTPK